MHHALQLSARGESHVEPNPMVGCVIVKEDQIIGEGWHQEFGGPHAEIHALRDAGKRAAGATMFVTLEPCCHQGKTPPCTMAIIDARIARVVVATKDPFSQVAGQGIEQLRAAGVQVDVGLLKTHAMWLNAPYWKRVKRGRPWILAKWAMTLDGKLASREYHSQWISSPESRQVVHRIRGRMDGVMVGSRTANRDDPLLTARPAGVRKAARIVVDSQASLSLTSQLVTTAREVPVIVAVAADAPVKKTDRLSELGCDVVVCQGNDHLQRLGDLLATLAQRHFTNLLVEGGGQLLGNLLELNEIDEVHAFVAPKLVGGTHAITPMAGTGLPTMDAALRVYQPTSQQSGADVYIHGRIERKNEPGDLSVC